MLACGYDCLWWKSLMSASPIPPNPEQLRLIEGAQPMIYNTVAASMAFIWEYCITIDVEVELIWRFKWTWVTLLFFAIRYLTLTNVILTMVIFTDVGQLTLSQKTCSSVEWLHLISVQVVLTCVEMLLITRVYALYARKRVLLGALIILFVCATAARFSLIAVVTSRLVIIPNPFLKSLPLGACISINLSSLFSQAANHIWVPDFTLQIVLFSLVISRILWTRSRDKTAASHLLVVLVRDGIWAFVFIFGGSLSSLLELNLQKQPSAILSLTWIYSLLGFCGTRLILNLRSAAMPPVVPVYPGALELDVPHQAQVAFNGISIEREVFIWDGCAPVSETPGIR